MTEEEFAQVDHRLKRLEKVLGTLISWFMGNGLSGPETKKLLSMLEAADDSDRNV